MQGTDEARAVVQFGRFRLHPHRRELFVEGKPAHIGSRAFDLLVALIEARGALVTKDEILSRVWPNLVVDENNIQVQVSTLRKALGEDRDLIRTIPGRGYRFVADIYPVPDEAKARPGLGIEPAASLSPLRSGTNLPAATSELIGRESEIASVADLTAVHRLVTLIGIGGIGKMRLGLEVARQLRPRFADGVWIAEFGPLTDPGLVPVTVATTLGLELPPGPVTCERVAAALGSKALLLLLANCEHVIDAAAGMAEALLRANPSIRVVATSREPLRAEGECIYRVQPLELPAEGTRDADEVLRCGAVRLFVARGRAADPNFSPDAHVAADICRRLDGIPLAIELAAARAATLGVEGLAARLHDRFRLLTGGRRTALPRHQTLRATLDWSYELLPEPERVILCRLGVFAGSFTLEAAAAVVTSGDIEPSDVVGRVANLVTKSLVAADVASPSSRYRLLETTRAYALERLAASGDLDQAARRHAEYHRDLFERAAAESQKQPRAEWLATYRNRIDDARAALDWAFSQGGDAALGVALTIAAVPLWMNLSLAEECCGRVQRALASLSSEDNRDPLHEMQLCTALASSLTFARGHVREGGAAWARALELAESLDDSEYRLRALWGMWAYRLSRGECRVALHLAQEFCNLVAKEADITNQPICDRMIGFSLHYLGDQDDARRHLERMLESYAEPARDSHIIRFQYGQAETARAVLARVLWLQGFPDRAVDAARRSVDEARRINHPSSLCYVLASSACPLALFIDDLAAAELYLTLLLDHSAKHGLVVWSIWGRCLQAILTIKQGNAVAGSRLLETALDDLRRTGFALPYTAFLCALADGRRALGQAAHGLELIDKAIARSERDEQFWFLPELLRVKGELVSSMAERRTLATVEEHFVKALDWARRQRALAWELRAATSLARVWLDQGRSSEAHDLLDGTYGRFSEGFETADLRAAKMLLELC